MYYFRGRAWSFKEDYGHALIDFNKFISLDPTSSKGYNERAEIWVVTNEFDKAMADYNEAIRLDPKDPLPLSGRADLYLERKEYEKALSDYDTAIRLKPNDSLSYSGRGNAYNAKKEYEKALSDYDAAIRLDPTDEDAYNSRAWLWATCRDSKWRDGKKAIASATKACELTSWKEPKTLDTLAAAHAEAGDFDQAVKRQLEALRLEPADGDDAGPIRERLALYRDKKPYRQP